MIEDARFLNLEPLGHFDIAFLGDILEHMNKRDALNLLTRVLSVARYPIISIPITFTPQDAFEGNPFEVHVKPDWSHEEVMLSFPAVKAWYVEGINGVYVLAPDDNDAATFLSILKSIDSNVTVNAEKFGYGEISYIKRILMNFTYIGIKTLRPSYYSMRKIAKKYKSRLM